ncbi:hypothetical protein [Photobacterium sp.]|uniref:hypothetical protein n=1 Tax=Photobacterium sp. TaxID=660 RepID=UPI00299ECBAF|nr:hypothetical protein [Photobacterium sp.]MDX1303537.1 hypothetical protein [Photobacterium sp.]
MISSLEAFPTELCTASVDNDNFHSYPQAITRSHLLHATSDFLAISAKENITFKPKLQKSTLPGIDNSYAQLHFTFKFSVNVSLTSASKILPLSSPY